MKFSNKNEALNIVETSYLASFSSLLWIALYYLPIGGALLRLILPLPLILLHLRRGTKIALGEALPGHLFVIESPSGLKRQGIEALDAIDPITNQPASWVSEDQIDLLQESGIPFQNLTDYIAQHFSEVVKLHSDEIMTRQNAQSLLDLVKNTNAAIVRELVPDLLSLGQVHKVLQTLRLTILGGYLL